MSLIVEYILGRYVRDTPYIRGRRIYATAERATVCDLAEMCARARVRVYICGEVWWLLACLPACLPRLSGALPDRTLNPARLNLGIIRGYKPRRYSAPRTPANLPRDISSAAFDREEGPRPLVLPRSPDGGAVSTHLRPRLTPRTGRLASLDPNCCFARIAREHFRR